MNSANYQKRLTNLRRERVWLMEEYADCIKTGNDPVLKRKILDRINYVETEITKRKVSDTYLSRRRIMSFLAQKSG